jgi:hypothetical protein
MPRYTQNPIEVEIEEIVKGSPLPFSKDGAEYTGSLESTLLSLKYNDTSLVVEEGDFIVKRSDGTFYPITRASVEANFTLKE